MDQVSLANSGLSGFLVRCVDGKLAFPLRDGHVENSDGFSRDVQGGPCYGREKEL